MERLLRPRSIALVGASAKAGSLGEAVLLNLMNSAYDGELYLVNPKRPVIHGRECLGAIDELPEGVDCAVLAIPGSAVLEATRACARRHAGSVIIFSSGFAESGEAGRRAQAELAHIARESGMLIEGPNCLGMVNYVDAVPLTFVVTPPQPHREVSGVAIVSQSGALAAVIAVNMRHHAMRLTYSISTGNEADQSVEDFIEYLIDDAGTRVVALVVEQFRKPARLLELAGIARRRNKFLVLLHPGSSSGARASAATHTGALAGDYELMKTLVTHAGVVHVGTLEELVDVAQILACIRELPDKGAAVFTESGAFKAHTLDLCERVGLPLPRLSRGAEDALRAALPPFIPPSNPLDLTAQGLVDPDLYRRTLPAVLGDDQFGSVFLGIILTDPTTTALKLPPILDAIQSLKPDKPVIFAALDEGAPFNAEGIIRLRNLGIPCFPSAERALRALARVTAMGSRNIRESAASAETQPAGERLTQEDSVEHRAKHIAQRFGIPIPPGKLARSLDEAKDVARTIGFPVVLKVQSVALPHKSDAKGVITGIQTDRELADAWAALHSSIEVSRPDIALDGVLVERMHRAGIEMILGARRDSAWGPVLMAGFGGVLAEATHDVRLLAPDLSADEIEVELLSLRSAALLRGFRGAPEADVPALARILASLGALIGCHPEISEIDLNPVVVYARGEGAVALDALMVVEEDLPDCQSNSEEQP